MRAAANSINGRERDNQPRKVPTCAKRGPPRSCRCAGRGSRRCAFGRSTSGSGAWTTWRCIFVKTTPEMLPPLFAICLRPSFTQGSSAGYPFPELRSCNPQQNLPTLKPPTAVLVLRVPCRVKFSLLVEPVACACHDVAQLCGRAVYPRGPRRLSYGGTSCACRRRCTRSAAGPSVYSRPSCIGWTRLAEFLACSDAALRACREAL